jgi:sulfhydrogenase subunit beta (sulfur reductase)
MTLPLAPQFLPREQFQQLLDTLHHNGHKVYGPQVRDDAIIYAPLKTTADLPQGIEDHHAPGNYRLKDNGSQHWFDSASTPQGIKPLLFKPRETLWRATRDAMGAVHFKDPENDAEKIAIIGARACDLAALKLQDQHFLSIENTPDPFYAARRHNLFIIAINCTRAVDTCFCSSTGDGPKCHDGFDIVMTELDHGFVVASGSQQGQQLIKQLALTDADEQQLSEATQREANATQQQRSVPSQNMRDTLFNALDHPQWDDIASRCLSCGNCTSVCPSCFCYSEHAEPTLDGSITEQLREWDSCFTQGHSYMHGITVRHDTKLRYRQWLTHKFAGWHDQFGRSGCTGCGRCITWCPPGIDITQELAILSKAEEKRDDA